MRLHRQLDDGPPCPFMEDRLQRTADGSAGLFTRWYTLAHVRGCDHCATFLYRLEETLGRLRELRTVETQEDRVVIQRLSEGPWRAIAGESEP